MDWLKKLLGWKDVRQQPTEVSDAVDDWLRKFHFDEQSVYEAVKNLSKTELEEGMKLLPLASKTFYYGLEVKEYIRLFKSMILGLDFEHHTEVRKRIDWDKLELERHLVLKADEVRPEHSWTEVLQNGQSVVRRQPEMWLFTLLLAYEDCRYFLALLILSKKDGTWCFNNNSNQDIPLVDEKQLWSLPPNAKERVRAFVNQEKDAPMPKELIKVMVHNYLLQNSYV